MLLTLIACTDPTPPPARPTPDDTAGEHATDTAADTAADTGADSGADTDTAGDTAPDTALPPIAFPWQAEGFWTDPGPLAALLTDNPDARERIRIATSEDGATWTARELPIAWGMSSLNLFVVPDEGVIVLGLLEADLGLPLSPGEVYAVASADLETWGTAAWRVEGLDTLQNLVDPSFAWSLQGELELLYYATDFQQGDPIDYPGDHRIRRAKWHHDLGRFLGEPEDLYAEEALADPASCRLGDEELLFVTYDAADIHVASRGPEDATFTRLPELDWPDRTVPWCREDGDGVAIYAQSHDLFPVHGYAGRIAADGTFTDLGELFATSPFGGDSCASIAVDRLRDTWILVCTEPNVRGLE